MQTNFGPIAPPDFDPGVLSVESWLSEDAEAAILIEIYAESKEALYTGQAGTWSRRAGTA